MKYARPPKPKLWRWIFLSFLGHGVATTVYLVFSVSKPLYVNAPRVISVSIVRKGKPRDENLLPRQVSAENEPPPQIHELEKKSEPKKEVEKKGMRLML